MVTTSASILRRGAASTLPLWIRAIWSCSAAPWSLRKADRSAVAGAHWIRQGTSRLKTAPTTPRAARRNPMASHFAMPRPFFPDIAICSSTPSSLSPPPPPLPLSPHPSSPSYFFSFFLLFTSPPLCLVLYLARYALL